MGVKGLMKSPPPVLGKRATAAKACELMEDRGIGAVVVVDEDGRPCGVFTYRDLISRVVLARRDSDHVPLGEVMTAKVDTIGVSQSYGDALRMMVDRDYTVVPVVDEPGNVVGTLAMRDLFEHEIDHLAQELDSVTQYLAVDGSGGD